MEISLIKNRDFIIFGLQPWDISIGSNCKNIAAEIARHNRVLYVNRPLDRISRYKSKNNIQTQNRLESIKNNKNVITEISSHLWVFNPRVIMESINFLPPCKIYNYFNKANNKKLAGEITWAMKKLAFSEPILLIDNDFFNGLYLKEFFQPFFFVYYIRDFLLSQKYFIRHGFRAEQEIIKKADAVATNSKYLAGYASKYNPNTANVGQGCDVEDFLEAPAFLTSDIKDIKFPVIGYCGSLTATRLDIGLIQFIAEKRPNWNIALVGPEDEVFKASSLHQQSNVYFLGSKKQHELPGYTHAFDVCINPQLLNQMTIGNYPRKVDEYLAAGKPVVATNTEAMEMFSEHAYLCNNKEEYLEKIELALKDTNDKLRIDARKQMAKSHTWLASVQEIYKLIIKTGYNGRK
jgi:teichuronic acid biosynthesis glycosyltransferase TuaH